MVPQDSGSTPVADTPPPPSPPPAGKGIKPRDKINSAYRPLFDQIVAKIRSNLPKADAEFDAPREEVLIALSAEGSGALHLERAGRSIFHSQMQALDAFKLRTEPVTEADFRVYYDRAAASHPAVYSNYRFEQWLWFLIGNELVSRDPDGTLTITEAGRVLGQYMAERGYTVHPWA